MSIEEYAGQQVQQTPVDEYNSLAFVVKQLLNKIATATLVKVVSVTNAGGVSPIGTVNVQILVNQISGNQQAQAHGVLYEVPYWRLCGGRNAVIMDPQVGDIGVCIFCMRDISAVVAAKDVANPGSARTYNWADGLYIGAFLSEAPEQYVQYDTSGIKVYSPTKVTIEAPQIDLKGAVAQTNGDVTMSQKLTVTNDVKSTSGDVLAQTVSLHNHTHPDPQGGNTGPPNP